MKKMGTTTAHRVVMIPMMSTMLIAMTMEPDEDDIVIVDMNQLRSDAE